MQIVRLIVEVAISDGAGELERVKAALRSAWPAIEIDAATHRRRQPRMVVCVQCGETFLSKRTDARYCTNACRTAASLERTGQRTANGDAPEGREVSET
jgi:hypothetical protein